MKLRGRPEEKLASLLSLTLRYESMGIKWDSVPQ